MHFRQATPLTTLTFPSHRLRPIRQTCSPAVGMLEHLLFTIPALFQLISPVICKQSRMARVIQPFLWQHCWPKRSTQTATHCLLPAYGVTIQAPMSIFSSSRVAVALAIYWDSHQPATALIFLEQRFL